MSVTEDRVRQILEGVTVDGAQLRIAAQLERAEYVAVNRILENLGGRWNRKQKAHVFPADSDPAVLIANAHVATEHAAVETAETVEAAVPPPRSRRRRPTDAERQQRRQRDRELRQAADELLQTPEQAAQLDTYLTTAAVSARVRGYSLRNQALLYTQATARGIPLSDVATYRQWAEQGRQVRRGEVGLRIVAPKGQQHRGEDTQAKAETDADSADAAAEESGECSGRTRFRMTTVFDLSQTDPTTPQEQEHT